MTHRIKLLACAGLSCLALCVGGTTSAQTPVLGGPQGGYDGPLQRRSIAITAGKSASIDFDGDLRMGGTTNPKVAEVRIVTPRHVTILGNGYGQTDAQFYNAAGKLVLTLDVRVEQDMKAIQDTMSRIIPNATIQTQAVNDGIILTGVVANAAEADKAVQIAAMYAGKPDMVRNLLTVTGRDQVTLKVQVIEVNRSVMKQLGFNTNFILGQLGMPQYVLGNTPSYAVNGGFQGGAGLGYRVDTTSQPVALPVNPLFPGLSNIPLTGTGIDLATIPRFVNGYLRGDIPLTAVQTNWVKRYLAGFVGPLTAIDPTTGATVNMTNAGVTLDNLPSLAQQYAAGGAGLTTTQSRWLSTFTSNLPRYNESYVLTPDSTFIDRTNPANALGTGRAGSTGLNQGGALIEAFERQGMVRTLAEPNVTAVSGESAKFLAGGQYPVPTGRDQAGNVTIEFKDYGVGLGFTPVVLSDGRISLKLSTEVSELTTQGALTIQGLAGSGSSTVIPALTVRRLENTIELPSGGSMMIGGLLQEQTRQNIDKIPGIADVPIMGALARSRDYLNNESELVIIVTAYLTGPTSRDKLQTPADGLRIASDAETALLGKLNSAYKAPAQATEGRTYQGPFGHVIE